MDTRKIVILGGGYAGIEAARKLYKKFRKDESVEITIIDRNTYHTLMTELHEVAGSRVVPDSVMISYERIFSGTDIEIVSDNITGIDYEKKVLISDLNRYEYDYLVLGTGGAPEFFDLPGIQENSFSLWSLEDAIKIREHIEEQFRLAAKEPDIKKREKMLTFAVAGAGFTGIELIGEIAERKKTLCRRYHIDKKSVNLIVIEALDSILPIIEENLREKALKYMTKKGIRVFLGKRILESSDGKVILDDATEINAGTFVWTCGIHGSEFTSQIDIAKGSEAFGKCSIASASGIHGMSGSRFEVDEVRVVAKRGRILVNKYMQTPDHPDIYAVGDNMWFIEEEKPLPQIVETALQTGKTAAENIIADIEGLEKKPFKSNYHGFMVSIGSRYAVSNAGGLKLSGFFAMAMKHLVNLHYLFGLAGLNTVWGYLKHEFFDMKDRRTFIGDHLSWKIQGWWGVPLRFWLGIMWLTEGINKIGEGWLSFSSGSKSGWMFSRGVVQKGVEVVSDVSAATGSADAAAEYAADAVSAASGVVEEAAGHAADAVSAASAAAAGMTEGAIETASDHIAWIFGKIWDTGKSIFPYDSFIVTWFRETFMDHMMAYISYPLFQFMIVAVEIAIGLALMGGLFTWLAAAGSIAMCAVFTFSGMFSWDQLWFVFAAFLMLGGAGRSFGLDHWVMPFIKRLWNSTSIAKKTHLYINEPVVRKRVKLEKQR